MVQYQIKLRLSSAQERELERWLLHLTSVWNWAIRKIELNARNKVYFSALDFQNLLADHGKKLGVPSHTLQGVLRTAHLSWQRCFRGLARKPQVKGKRRPLNAIPLPDPLKAPGQGKLRLPGVGKARFHKMALPVGKIKCGRLCRRASGWYLCLFIEAQPKAIEREASGAIGIDPGFKHLLTTSDGEIIEHPHELRLKGRRLAQAQRGKRKHLAARLQERIANRRKDRNHKLSRWLVAENTAIYFLKDNHRAIAGRFGKSVGDSAHSQLRTMLSYKSLLGGAKYSEVDARNSTKTCSTCWALSGPTGLAGLSVRHWECEECGTHHLRDVNSARYALIVGAGAAHEGYAHAA